MGYRPTHAAPTSRSPRLDRRGFLSVLAIGTLAAVGGWAEFEHATSHGRPSPAAAGTGEAAVSPVGAPPTTLAPVVPATASVSPVGSASPTMSLAAQVVPDSLIDRLPDGGPRVAWTVDDGTSSEVVGAYADFLRISGVRMTFFLNGINPSWTDHAPALIPLVESGQVQMANHTWSHPDLTTLSDSRIADELTRNDAFIRSTYGVSAKPFLRPPYGFHNERVDRVAADLGYTTMTTWYGSLGDSSILTPAQVLANAKQWMTAGRIVIGHANHPAVTHVLDSILEVLRERSLQTVTLDDVFRVS